MDSLITSDRECRNIDREKLRKRERARARERDDVAARAKDFRSNRDEAIGGAVNGLERSRDLEQRYKD